MNQVRRHSDVFGLPSLGPSVGDPEVAIASIYKDVRNANIVWNNICLLSLQTYIL